MSKIKSLEQITPGQTGQTPVPSNDLLSRADNLITNFKGLMQMAIAHKQGQSLQSTQSPESEPEGGQPRQSEIATLMQILVKFGYGNTPVGKLLEQVSGFTINQIMGVLQNAVRPKQ